MFSISSNRTFAVLLVLSLASFAAFEVASGALLAWVAMFALAAIKVQLIVSGFMHLRWHHRPFRQLLLLWSLAVFVILAGSLFAISPQ